MAYYRVCKICECSLDPGEGNICEDCICEIERKDHRQAALVESIQEAEGGQMIMRQIVI